MLLHFILLVLDCDIGFALKCIEHRWFTLCQHEEEFDEYLASPECAELITDEKVVVFFSLYQIK